MRGNISGRQSITYGSGGKAYDEILTGSIGVAVNYQPRIVARVLRLNETNMLRNFQVRTRSSVNMSANMRRNLALMGGVGAIFAAIVSDKTTQLYNDCVNACPNNMTLRSFLAPILRQGLAAKDSMIIISGDVAINNPWISGGTGVNVNITQAILIKFDSVLGLGEISPYSDAATIALKDTFPSQWPTIRDYGISHTEIVPYMNAYAREDPKIAYSLVPGLGTRWINNGGTGANIDTGIVRYVAHTYKFAGLMNYSAVTSRQLNGAQGYVYFGVVNNGYQIGQGGNDVALTGAVANANINFEVTFYCTENKVSAIVNGVSYNGNVTYSDSPSGAHLFLFSLNDNVLPSNCKISHFEIWQDGVKIRDYVPYIKNSQNGVLDLVNGIFYQNAGTGSFTIYETPA